MHLKIILSVVLLLLFGPAASHAVFVGTVEIQSIQILPVETNAGNHPEISGTIKASSSKASNETMEINVIASLVRPDNAMKSWTWKKIRIKANESKVFTIPDRKSTRLNSSHQ